MVRRIALRKQDVRTFGEGSGLICVDNCTAISSIGNTLDIALRRMAWCASVFSQTLCAHQIDLAR
jgi:hypothetical protein